jgi:hypothetical protein
MSHLGDECGSWLICARAGQPVGAGERANAPVSDGKNADKISNPQDYDMY